MKSLQWITNIPTPYRNHRYETMSRVFPEYDLSFEVLYMAWTEADRQWNFTPDDLHYPNRVMPGFNTRIKGVNLYTNPKLLSHIRHSDPDIVLVGGFSAPTLLAAPFMCSKKTILLLGVESNVESSTYRRGVVHRLKRSMIRRYDGFMIPGGASRSYIERLDPESSQKPFLVLPNIVDRSDLENTPSSQHDIDVLRTKYGALPTDHLWLSVARLIPIKGLMEFLPLLSGVEGVQLVIAGEGDQRAQLEEMINLQRLPVHLIGHLEPGRLRDFYTAADLFVLPSLKDPSPLSAVEAASSGLPLMLNRNVGNARDLVVHQESGWIIEIADRDRAREIVESAAAMSRVELAGMGRRSLEIYNSRFDSEAAIRNFAKDLTRLVSIRDGGS